MRFALVLAGVVVGWVIGWSTTPPYPAIPMFRCHEIVGEVNP